MHFCSNLKLIDLNRINRRTYNSHSIAKSKLAPSVGTPIAERIVTTRTMLALGMLGVAREEVKVRNLDKGSINNIDYNY